mmetsp:Transcript_63236/g.186992  ORF Transcript_63236/g.186992 Transcript_63236/m.186992 type:complete len:80 (+) Transcript_63236:2647-2886(+)
MSLKCAFDRSEYLKSGAMHSVFFGRGLLYQSPGGGFWWCPFFYAEIFISTYDSCLTTLKFPKCGLQCPEMMKKQSSRPL